MDRQAIKNQTKDLTPYTESQVDYLHFVLNNMAYPWAPFSDGNVSLASEVGAWRDNFTLTIDGLCYMTTQGVDLLDHAKILEEATGDILLTGCGLGVGVLLADLNTNVQSVTILELNPIILSNIAPLLTASCQRITPKFIECDANTWMLSRSFDFTFIDHAHARADDARYREQIPNVVNWYDERLALEATWR